MRLNGPVQLTAWGDYTQIGADGKLALFNIINERQREVNVPARAAVY